MRSSRSGARRAGGEHGATTVWFLAVVVAVGLVVAATGRWGGAVGADARTQSVADVAALAAVTGGDAAAHEVARRNGSRVIRLVRRGSRVEVVVARAGLEAAAAADAAPDGARPGAP